MWNKIKQWLLGKVQDVAVAEIGNLSKLTPQLSALISKEADPDARSKQVVDWVQGQLTGVINKAFSAKLLSGLVFSSVKAAALAEVSSLDNYEDDIAAFLKRNINPDQQAALIVNYVQDYLTSLVKKYIQKI